MLSKNQRRKLERYGVVPQGIEEKGLKLGKDPALFHLFWNQIKTVKKCIYRKPRYKILSPYNPKEDEGIKTKTMYFEI